MELIRFGFNICSYVTALCLIPYVIHFVVLIFKILLSLLKRESINRKVLEELKLNPFAILQPIKSTSDNSNNKEDILQLKASKIIRIMMIIGLIGLTFEIIKYTPLGSDSIGSFIEKNEYTTYYYVNMFPRGSSSKNYKLKAEIYSHEDNFERHYHIQKAFLNTSAYLSFFVNGNEKTLSLNKKVTITDDKGLIWDIELTSQKVANAR